MHRNPLPDRCPRPDSFRRDYTRTRRRGSTPRDPPPGAWRGAPRAGRSPPSPRRPEVLFHEQGFQLPRAGVEQYETLPARPVQGAGVHHEGRTAAVLLGLVGVAVEQVIEAAALQLAQQSLVVPVSPGDLAAFHLQVAERLVKHGAGPFHRPAQVVAVQVAVAEDEMGPEPAEQL